MKDHNDQVIICLKLKVTLSLMFPTHPNPRDQCYNMDYFGNGQKYSAVTTYHRVRIVCIFSQIEKRGC